MSNQPRATRLRACELKNKLVLLAVFLMWLAAPAMAAAQEHAAPAKPADTHAAAPGQHAPEGEHAAEEHGMWSGLLWPTVNFLILVGGLWWFLKQPITTYLADRHASIRSDLVEAANVRAAAAAHLDEIERRLQALPREIEALKHRGAEEIAAEEHRIAAMAAAERDRLLEQTRREIELQVRLAKRELVEHAADLAVQLAGDRIRETMTPADQNRLVDRYLDQVKKH